MLKIQAICRWWPGKHERIRDEIDTPTFETQSEESGETPSCSIAKMAMEPHREYVEQFSSAPRGPRPLSGNTGHSWSEWPKWELWSNQSGQDAKAGIASDSVCHITV
jgi:hypothetical protein